MDARLMGYHRKLTVGIQHASSCKRYARMLVEVLNKKNGGQHSPPLHLVRPDY